MVQKKQVTLMAHEEDLGKIKEGLLKYFIEPEDKDDHAYFELQASNVIYEVRLFVAERMSEDERMMMFTRAPIVNSFEDIQLKTVGHVVWDWR